MAALNLYRRKILALNKQISKCFRRGYMEKNFLSLADRGFIKDYFPDNAGPSIRKLFITKPQTIYAGFDPTADSLHIGNLLVLMGLLHAQRGGHQPIALLGGATGRIGDPSGRHTERSALGFSILEANLQAIKRQIERIFKNHENYLWPTKSEPVKSVRILNNADWYAGTHFVSFISKMGRHFRMGDLLSRSSVQARLQGDSGMSFTEFSYQVFQAYDWLHLYRDHDCRFQIGGSDQMGNIMTGYELITRVENQQVFGLTLPIITNEEGNKFGKSAGNAIWLDENKTSPFSLYQFFVRVPDAEVESLLKLLTFISLNDIDNIMKEHRKVPELRDAQRRLAQEITMLIHGKSGVERAETTSQALYKGSIDALANLNANDIQQSFTGATLCDVRQEPGMSLLNLAMKVKCFSNESDACRIIKAGGFYVNQQRATNFNEIISPTVHILQNGMTLLRVGKKNYYIINWSD